MKFRTNQERQTAIALLAEYIDAQPDGEELSWMRIEADTGIKMDAAGKHWLRHVLRRRPYESVRGIGIRLSSPASAMTIARTKLVQIDHSVRRADKTTSLLQERHMAQMQAHEQQRMLMLVSFFGAIRTVAKNATSKVFTPKPKADG